MAQLCAPAIATAPAVSSTMPSVRLLSSATPVLSRWTNHTSCRLIRSRFFTVQKDTSVSASSPTAEACMPRLLPGCAPRSWSGFLPLCTVGGSPAQSNISSNSSCGLQETVVKRKGCKRREKRVFRLRRTRAKTEEDTCSFIADMLKKQQKEKVTGAQVWAREREKKSALYSAGPTQKRRSFSHRQREETYVKKENTSSSCDVAPLMKTEEQHVLAYPPSESGEDGNELHVHEKSSKMQVSRQDPVKSALRPPLPSSAKTEENGEAQTKNLFLRKHLLLLNKPPCVSATAFLRQAEVLLYSDGLPRSSMLDPHIRKEATSGPRYIPTVSPLDSVSTSNSSSSEPLADSSDIRKGANEDSNSDSTHSLSSLKEVGNDILGDICVLQNGGRTKSESCRGTAAARTSSKEGSSTVQYVEDRRSFRFLSSFDLEASGAVILLCEPKDVIRQRNSAARASAEMHSCVEASTREEAHSIKESGSSTVQHEFAVTARLEHPGSMRTVNIPLYREKGASTGPCLDDEHTLPVDKANPKESRDETDYFSSFKSPAPQWPGEHISGIPEKIFSRQKRLRETSWSAKDDLKRGGENATAHSREDYRALEPVARESASHEEVKSSEAKLQSEANGNATGEAHRYKDSNHPTRFVAEDPFICSNQDRDELIYEGPIPEDCVSNGTDDRLIKPRPHAEEFITRRSPSNTHARAVAEHSEGWRGDCNSDGREVLAVRGTRCSRRIEGDHTHDREAFARPGSCDNRSEDIVDFEERCHDCRRTATSASKGVQVNSVKESGRKPSVHEWPSSLLFGYGNVLPSSWEQFDSSKRRVVVLPVTEKDPLCFHASPVVNMTSIYLAVVAGHMPIDLIHCHASICKPTPGCVDYRLAGRRVEGSSCYSIWRPIIHAHCAGGHATLAEVRHVEGPPCVVRLHATCLGFPIIGDRMYASSRRSIPESKKCQALSCERLLLHRWILKVYDFSEALTASQQSAKDQKMSEKFLGGGEQGKCRGLAGKVGTEKMHGRGGLLEDDADGTNRSGVEKAGMLPARASDSMEAEKAHADNDLQLDSALRDHSWQLRSPAHRQAVTVVVAPDSLSKEMNLPPRCPWQSFLFSDSVIMQNHPFFEPLLVLDADGEPQQEARGSAGENLLSDVRSGMKESCTGISKMVRRFSQRYSDNNTYWDRNVGY